MSTQTFPLAHGQRADDLAAEPRRLQARTVAASSLTHDELGQAYVLFANAYEGADRKRFEHDLAEKQQVILLTDHRSGELKGFSTVLVREVVCDGRPATVVFSGDTVIDRRYWGQKMLQREFARVLARLKLRNLRRPLYWFLISKGYRTYLLLANAFPVAVPRYDSFDRAELRTLLDELATERFGEQYDRIAGVVHYETLHERVRDGLAPVSDALLDNPHVRFYVQRNPGHTHGDELACLARVRLFDLALASLRIARAQIARRLGA